MSHLPIEDGLWCSTCSSMQATQSHSQQPSHIQPLQPRNESIHFNDNDNLQLTTPPPPNNLTPPIEDDNHDNDLSFHSTQGSDDLWLLHNLHKFCTNLLFDGSTRF
jgi:hypothetical protein